MVNLPPGVRRDQNGDYYDEITGSCLERCENCGDFIDPLGEDERVGYTGLCFNCHFLINNNPPYTMGYKNNDPCLDKAADDEPLFVLRGQDASAAKVVIHWIAKNFDTCPDEKLREAFEQALAMKNYPVHKKAD